MSCENQARNIQIVKSQSNFYFSFFSFSHVMFNVMKILTDSTSSADPLQVENALVHALIVIKNLKLET